MLLDPADSPDGSNIESLLAECTAFDGWDPEAAQLVAYRLAARVRRDCSAGGFVFDLAVTTWAGSSATASACESDAQA